METTAQAVEQQERSVAAGSTDRLIRHIKKTTRRKYTAEDKIRIVLEGFRKEIPVSELCRREGLHVNVYYVWLKDFMEGGKARLRGDTLRSATREEVRVLQEENRQLKEMGAELALQVRLLKKSLLV